MLPKNQSEIDYAKYSFEDFLQDDYFVHTIKEKQKFWENFENNTPDNLDEFIKAKNFITNLPDSDYFLQEAEIEDIWSNIKEITQIKKKRKILRYLIMTSVSAAVILLFLLVFNPSDLVIEQESIYAYANREKAIDISKIKNTRLILSDEKNIEIEDDYAEKIITYDSLNISTGKENITKNDVAAYNEIIVPKGRRSQLHLSDGTKIWINAGTRLVYPTEFKSKYREIYVDGEIYIEVAHNKESPFLVKTVDFEVKVLGTSFNVSSYESAESKSVLLASGSVEISNNKSKQKTLLNPSTMYALVNETESVKQNIDVSKYISWKDGIYVYDNEKLASLLDFLSEYYDCEITYSPELANLKCSGKLEMKNSLESVLSNLSYALPITYQEQDGKYIVLDINK